MFCEFRRSSVQVISANDRAHDTRMGHLQPIMHGCQTAEVQGPVPFLIFTTSPSPAPQPSAPRTPSQGLVGDLRPCETGHLAQVTSLEAYFSRHVWGYLSSTILHIKYQDVMSCSSTFELRALEEDKTSILPLHSYVFQFTLDSFHFLSFYTVFPIVPLWSLDCKKKCDP